MFTTIIVQPIFNLLVFIYAILPGHNFGIAVILFTIIVRLLMWPLVKKQMHQTKLMRKVQPELKRIKKAAGGNRQKESMLMMELYKERGIKPFAQIGVLLIQVPILLGLYAGLRRVLDNPHELVSFAYPFLQHLSWLQHLNQNIHAFDATLFGIADLTKPALTAGGIYWPALVIVLGSAAIQYFQGKQLMPAPKDNRKLRDILRDAKDGKQADQSDVSAAMMRNTTFLMPVLVLLFTVHLASALGLYWLTSGIVAYIQQAILLREDVNEMEAQVDKADQSAAREKQAIAAEVVSDVPSKAKATKKSRKRRK